MSSSDNLAPVVHRVQVMLAERRALRSHGPHFKIVTRCSNGITEVLAVFLVHRGGEFLLPLGGALRFLFDFLARHSRFGLSATQIAAMTGPKTRSGVKCMRIARTSVKEFVKRIRRALEIAFHEAQLPIDPRQVLASEETVSRGVSYRLRGTVQWIHVDLPTG